VRLWRDPRVRWARSLAVAYPLLVVAALVLGGKSYYILPLLMVAMAAGALPVARWARTRGRIALLASALVVAAAVNVVITLPVLPPSAAGTVNAGPAP
jgi:O-antigen ligase